MDSNSRDSRDDMASRTSSPSSRRATRELFLSNTATVRRWVQDSSINNTFTYFTTTRTTSPSPTSLRGVCHIYAHTRYTIAACLFVCSVGALMPKIQAIPLQRGRERELSLSVGMYYYYCSFRAGRILCILTINKYYRYQVQYVYDQ